MISATGRYPKKYARVFGKRMAYVEAGEQMILEQNVFVEQILPGAILRAEALEFCRRWPNQKEVTVKGVHFVQEDSPEEIGPRVV